MHLTRGGYWTSGGESRWSLLQWPEGPSTWSLVWCNVLIIFLDDFVQMIKLIKKLSNSWFINAFVHSLRFRVKEKKKKRFLFLMSYPSGSVSQTRDTSMSRDHALETCHVTECDIVRCHTVASAYCHVAWQRFVTRSCGKHLTDAITTSSGKLSQAARTRILPAEINFGSIIAS